MTGGVLAPGGTVTVGNTSLWRFASVMSPAAVFALGPDVRLVGPNLSVRLRSTTARDALDGSIDDDQFVAGGTTDDEGRFSVALKNKAIGDCGLFLEVGSASRGTVMRALVYAEEQDVSAVSEAVVRLLLAYVAEHHVDLCVFFPREIERLADLVGGITGHVTGASVGELNDRVESISGADVRVRNLIRDAVTE